MQKSLYCPIVFIKTVEKMNQIYNDRISGCLGYVLGDLAICAKGHRKHSSLMKMFLILIIL